MHRDVTVEVRGWCEDGARMMRGWYGSSTVVMRGDSGTGGRRLFVVVVGAGRGLGLCRIVELSHEYKV